MPPYVVEEEDIDLMVRVAFESIDKYFGPKD
jgi:adenosylmethionine-8-amino-7-oxononanoate aminotransferase